MPSLEPLFTDYAKWLQNVGVYENEASIVPMVALHVLALNSVTFLLVVFFQKRASLFISALLPIFFVSGMMLWWGLFTGWWGQVKFTEVPANLIAAAIVCPALYVYPTATVIMIVWRWGAGVKSEHLVAVYALVLIVNTYSVLATIVGQGIAGH